MQPTDSDKSAATPLLPYGTRLGVGQIRVDRPSPQELYVEVGPAPPLQQIATVAPIAALSLLLSVAFGLLAFSALLRPGAIPRAGLLLIPTVVALGFCGMELLSAFRNAAASARLSVIGGRFGFPYPSARSATEDLDVTAVNRLNVVTTRTRLLRRRVSALEIGLSRGPRFLLFRGYPEKTLDELTDLLGPALGLTAADARGDDEPQMHTDGRR